MQAESEAEESLAGAGHVSMFVAIFVIGSLLRGWHLTEQCLTHDEVFEVQSIGQPFSEFFWSPDGFPPLHRILVWWGSRWASPESVGRWFAWVSGIVTLTGVYGIGTTIGGRRAGVGAMAWAAVSPLLVYYSQECRAYGLYLALGSLAIWAFCIAWRNDHRAAWIALVATCVAGELTHYYFALLVLIFGVLWVIERLRSRRWSRGVVMFSLLGVFQVCLYPLLREDLRETIGYPEQTAFGVLELGYTFYSFVGGYCLGPSQASLHQIDAGTAVTEFLPYLLALGLCLLMPAWHAVVELYRRRWLWPVAVLVIAPVVLAGVLAQILNLNYNVRYVVFAAVPISVALGVGWVTIRAVAMKVIIYTAMVGLCLGGLVQRNCVAEYRNEDVRSAAKLIRDTGEVADTLVLVNVGYMSRPLEYYLGAGWNVVQVPEDGNQNGVVESQNDVDTVLNLVGDADTRHVWALLSRSFHGDPAGILRHALVSRYRQEDRAEFDGVTVVKLK